MNNLNEDSWIVICSFLHLKEIWNLILSIKSFADTFSNSSKLLRRFILVVDKNNYKVIATSSMVQTIKFENIFINCDSFYLSFIFNLLQNYRKSVKNLTFKNLQFDSIEGTVSGFPNFTNLKSLSFENCQMQNDADGQLPIIQSLKSMLFHNCNGNFMNIFKNQINLEKLEVCRYKYTFNGFPHDEFNNLARSLQNLRHLVFLGDGTSSYFDVGHFPFKINILETTSITFHWYVSIRSARLDFLKCQLGSLRELTIHKLPCDFDGANVMKFIFDEMNLTKFIYGKIPLILNGLKQEVLEFSATETQIQSAFEMFRQFHSIRKFCLIINNIDVCSDAIENVVNPTTRIFANLKEFKLIDNSQFRGILGVFLGLYQNLTNIQSLIFDTQDRNINVILEECLPYMENLKEICLTSKVKNAGSRFETIKKFVKGLKKLTIPVEFVLIAKSIFEDRVEILGI